MAAYALVMMLIVGAMAWRRSRAASIIALLFALLLALTAYQVATGSWFLSWPFR
ncbi:MAG: hypothetical protein ABIO40_09530 [Devosia sp.]